MDGNRCVLKNGVNRERRAGEKVHAAWSGELRVAERSSSECWCKVRRRRPLLSPSRGSVKRELRSPIRMSGHLGNCSSSDRTSCEDQRGGRYTPATVTPRIQTDTPQWNEWVVVTRWRRRSVTNMATPPSAWPVFLSEGRIVELATQPGTPPIQNLP